MALTSHTLHNLSPRREALLPVRLPLQQVTRMQRVGSQLKDTAELTRWRSRPEAELLHEGRLLAGDERLELGVESRKVGVVLDRVERGVVAGVALVLPDVDCSSKVSIPNPPYST